MSSFMPIGKSGPPMANNDATNRKRSREMDIAESHYLLLELATQEPVLQHCLKTLQGVCLSQGVRLAKKGMHDQDADTKKWSSQATADFQRHIDKYWAPFCEEAIRMFYVCGFVPWHLRRLASTGDLVPEVIPLGTFDWYVELRTEKERRRNNDKNHTNMQQKASRISYVPALLDESKKNGHWGKVG